MTLLDSNGNPIPRASDTKSSIGVPLFGRSDIYTSITDFTPESVAKIINESMPLHLKNSAECERLMSVYKGNQKILRREKIVRNDIQDNIVLNYAKYVVDDGIGYFFSTPLQYKLREESKQEVFNEYTKLLVSEEKTSTDFENAMLAAITGAGYVMVVSDSEFNESDESPIEYIALDPRYSFVVRESKVTHNTVLGATYYVETIDEQDYTVYDVRTAKFRFVYRVRGSISAVVSAGDLVAGYPKQLGLPICPIVQFKNNMFMLCDFEPQMTLLDAINVLASNSLEDIEQFVQSLLVFINAFVDEDIFAKLMEQKFAVLKGDAGVTVDAKYIASQLNPESVKNLREHFIEVLLFLTATPDRRQSPSGGDTGVAVKLGNGYPAQENKANIRDMSWYKAERDIIKLSLAILHKSGLVMDLQSKDLQPIINRTLMETAQANAQTAVMMVLNRLWAQDDAVRFASPTSDAEQAIMNAKKAYGDNYGIAAGRAEQAVNTDA